MYHQYCYCGVILPWSIWSKFDYDYDDYDRHQYDKHIGSSGSMSTPSSSVSGHTLVEAVKYMLKFKEEEEGQLMTPDDSVQIPIGQLAVTFAFFFLLVLLYFCLWKLCVASSQRIYNNTYIHILYIHIAFIQLQPCMTSQIALDLFLCIWLQPCLWSHRARWWGGRQQGREGEAEVQTSTVQEDHEEIQTWEDNSQDTGRPVYQGQCAIIIIFVTSRCPVACLWQERDLILRLYHMGTPLKMLKYMFLHAREDHADPPLK